MLIKLKSVEKENASVNEMLTSVPTQEKQYRAIARATRIKRESFSFLDAKTGGGRNSEINLRGNS